MVTEVDGKRLVKPVHFYLALVEAINGRGQKVIPTDGAKWTMRAYEALEFRDTPNEYWKVTRGYDKEARAAAVWDQPYSSRLFGIVKQGSAKSAVVDK